LADQEAMTADADKRFPLPSEQEQFETKRTLVGLFKQGPLETNREFAERVAKTFQQHQVKHSQAKTNLPTRDDKNSD
jgi:hypothetical protein